MKPTKKIITKQKRILRVVKKRPIGLSDGARKEAKTPRGEKTTRSNLEKKIRRQMDNLKRKNGQLKDGAEQRIRSQEQIYLRTKAMDSTADGIFIINARKPDFPIIYANQSLAAMTGYTKKEIIGRNFLDLYGTDIGPRTVKEIKDTICQGEPFFGEMINLKKNGKKIWSSLRIVPIYGPGEVVAHYVGHQADVTLTREKELEIDRQREDLLHVTRVGKLAEFVSSLAHEISQPLAAILSYSQAAQRMFAGREPKLQEILQYIINDDQRAAAVIHRLRALLKKSAPEMKPVDINAIINETIVLITTDATVKNVILKLELENNLPLVRGDRIQLQQVLLNLISNSFDAIEDSPYLHEILIRTSRKDPDTIMAAVKDSGCGISAQNMPKLFTHFFTSKPDGLGMGLSISRSIVEAHGGRLDVENNPDRGVTFYFTIPVAAKNTP
jgi:PAS domain S-box-containing protein